MERELYDALKREALPRLRTWPSVRVWIPGCGAGDDVWAIATLIREARLWNRTWIWATDEAEDALRPAENEGERVLSERISFARHSLAEGASFNEFQLIICRPGIFDGMEESVARRAFSVLHGSLARSGILALGSGDSLELHPRAHDYARLSPEAELHRRVR
jgi:chemotaxis protein methyltransferase CheR